MKNLTLTTSGAALNIEPAVLDKINALRNKEISMSYSKLKHLTSPINFINNLMKPRTTNAGMNFGSLVDLLITEEHKFDQKYIVTDISVSKGNQEDLVNFTLQGDKSLPISDRFTAAFAKAYKRGKAEDYHYLLEYCQHLESGIACITKEQLEEAARVANNLKNQPVIEDILSQNDGMQKWVEFEWYGWKFKMVLDVWSLGNFYDFKFVSQFQPQTFHRDIEKFGYDIQFGLYSVGMNAAGLASPKTKGFFIPFDKELNFAVMEFGEDYESYAKRKVEVYLKRLDRVIEENAWFRSYDFFEPNMVIRKPAFLKGFAE